jgi:hypothetical protein
MQHVNKISIRASVAANEARLKALLCLLLLGAAFGFVGCGTPAAPAPPTLDLPQPVENLSATRSGDVLTFTWTEPRHNTDHLLLKGDVDVVICHKLPDGECEPINELSVVPGKDERVEVALPKALVSGEPRVAVFAVQSRNKLRRAAGLSNEALVIAGSAPLPIEALEAEEQRQGIVLCWKTLGDLESGQSVRLIRHRTSPASGTQSPGTPTKPSDKSNNSILAPAPEPELLTFLVNPGNNGHAVDRTAFTRESYEYRAERVVRITAQGQTLELKSALTEPVAIEVRDQYAPERPRGLAAVAASSEVASAQNQNGIDLSWQPNVDAGLVSPVAGYIVYRREGEAAWQRISGVALVVGPAFHDANVKAGATYSYVVTAVGVNTLESPRSEAATETIE